LPLTVWVYLPSNFSGGLRKTIFSAKMRFRRSRSSKVTDFGTNRKRVCESVIVTSVLSYTILGILQVFVLMTPPMFHPNLAVFPLDQIADVGVSVLRYLRQLGWKLFLKYSNLCDHVRYTERHRQTDRQTHTDRRADGQTDETIYCGITVRSIARWKRILP